MKIAIVGAGKLGQTLASALLGGDHSITIIDRNEEALQKISSQLDVMTINANAKDSRVLKQIHISSFDFIITATDRDEKNIVIAAFAKKLGCSQAIARVRDPEHVHQYDFIRDTMDIDYLVNPDKAVANEIYRYLIEKYTLRNGIFSTGKTALLEFRAMRYPSIIGKSIIELTETFPSMVIAAVSKSGKVIIPHGNTVIEETDALYVIGLKKDLAELNKKVHEKGKYTGLKKVMILGGGKTGFFLAQSMSDFGVSVKIIERNKERCLYISEKLDNVMVLQGDATDIDLLEEENLSEMDAVITCTGFDEDNLLLALTAKKKGVMVTIAKVSRGMYTDMISDLGVDMALNPLNIVTANIINMVQGSKKVINSTLIEGQAEIIEVNVEGHMPITDKPLRDLKLPDGMIFGYVSRGSEVIIPNGDTIIKANDKVAIVALLTEAATVETLIKNTKNRLFR